MWAFMLLVPVFWGLKPVLKLTAKKKNAFSFFFVCVCVCVCLFVYIAHAPLVQSLGGGGSVTALPSVRHFYIRIYNYIYIYPDMLAFYIFPLSSTPCMF